MELGGLEEADVLQKQLQTGQIEKPSILSAVESGGAIDITLVESEHHNKKIARVLDEIQDTVSGDTTRHQGTQTEVCSIPVANVLAHGPKADSDEEWR